MHAATSSVAGTPGKSTLTAGLPDPQAQFDRATSVGTSSVPYQREMEHAFGHDFSGVQAYTGQRDALTPIGARAAARGDVVAFGDPSPDKHTVAHELAHVMQARQAGGSIVQASTEVSAPSEPAEVEAEQVAARVAAGDRVGRLFAPPGRGLHRANMDDVPGLDKMQTPPGPNTPQIGYTKETVDRNSNDPNTALPWTQDGWKGQEILSKLGQYDRIAKTDSDSTRCVQAVALGSHILSGPEAVKAYLASVILDALLRPAGKAGFTERQKACKAVLDRVKDAISKKTATYGDLAWAQEAIHDLFFPDGSGTPEDQVNDQILPTFDLNSMTKLDIWCSTAAEVLAQAQKLANKQQLVVTTQTVSFNTTFDNGDDPDAKTMTVQVIDDKGKVLRTARIRRIDTTTKPRPGQIDNLRDSTTGHQVMIYKEADQLYCYDPEITPTGSHLSSIQQAGDLSSLVRDQPTFDMFGYVHILGKVTPSSIFDPAYGSWK